MVDIFDEKIMERLGYPFYYWACYGGFSITEKDLEYLEKIKNHPCFPMIIGGYQTLSPILDWANQRINQIVFYERFYKDPKCPPGIKNILFAMIGAERGNLEKHNMLKLLEFRYPYVEQWIYVTKKALLK
jgi:hypothetical protein